MYFNNIHKFYLSDNYPIILNRKDIPKLLNDFYIKNTTEDKLVSCEIGVQSGVFSKQILENFPLLTTHILVDCWAEQSKEIYNDSANRTDLIQENIFKNCINNLSVFKDKIEIIRKMSHIAYSDIPDNHLDFLYIDGNHSYDATKKDLNYWISKMKKNSIIAGHDYVQTPNFGVIKAVDEFCVDRNVFLHLTLNPKENISWFIFL